MSELFWATQLYGTRQHCWKQAKGFVSFYYSECGMSRSDKELKPSKRPFCLKCQRKIKNPLTNEDQR